MCRHDVTVLGLVVAWWVLFFASIFLLADCRVVSPADGGEILIRANQTLQCQRVGREAGYYRDYHCCMVEAGRSPRDRNCERDAALVEGGQ